MYPWLQIFFVARWVEKYFIQPGIYVILYSLLPNEVANADVLESRKYVGSTTGLPILRIEALRTL